MEVECYVFSIAKSVAMISGPEGETRLVTEQWIEDLVNEVILENKDAAQKMSDIIKGQQVISTTAPQFFCSFTEYLTDYTEQIEKLSTPLSEITPIQSSITRSPDGLAIKIQRQMFPFFVFNARYDGKSSDIGIDYARDQYNQANIETTPVTARFEVSGISSGSAPTLIMVLGGGAFKDATSAAKRVIELLYRDRRLA
jgi:hypothetical protein